MYRGVIYCYCIEGKYYVGKTLMQERKRIAKHKFDALTKNSQTPFARAIRKYGWQSVVSSYRVIEEIFDDDKQSLNSNLIVREKYWIEKYNSLIPNGYNVYKEGQESIPHIHNKQEMYLLVSKSLKGKYLNQPYSSKPVYCVELSRWFPSAQEAKRELGINHDSISRCAKGLICKAGGYTWNYTGSSATRKSGLMSKEIICVENGKKFSSCKDVAKWIVGINTDKKISNVYSNVKTAVKNGWACCGYHFIETGKTIPCYQTQNQYGKCGR